MVFNSHRRFHLEPLNEQNWRFMNSYVAFALLVATFPGFWGKKYATAADGIAPAKNHAPMKRSAQLW
jgi:hypothetical protein